MFSNFFIKRPIFAIVVSLVIVISGLISMFQLPIEQYPNMAPVQIMVTASYPGADAKTVAETVAAPIETQVNGVDNMIYMTSSSSSTGTMMLTVFFDIRNGSGYCSGAGTESCQYRTAVPAERSNPKRPAN